MVAPAPGSILLMSDVHAHYHVVNAQIEHAESERKCTVDQVLVLGDFGLFGPNLHDYFRRRRQRFQRPVSFLEGNHEDFRDFDQLVRDYADVITHLPRGSVHTLGPWRGLCIGGARYMDAWSTPPGCEISEGDIAGCLARRPEEVDVVLSHDCPSGIGVVNQTGFEHLGPPGVDGLADVATHLKPRWWFFGHHHRWHGYERDGTGFIGLPQSWEGYVLVDAAGTVTRVKHLVPLPKRPGWLRWIGLK